LTLIHPSPLPHRLLWSLKRSLKGTYLNSQNSFALLDNEVIANMASKIGVEIPELHFDSIDIMKDL
jgi:hypothetical protein